MRNLLSNLVLLSLLIVFSQQDRTRQVDVPRDQGRICGSLQANLNAMEQRAREAEEINRQLRANVLALQQQLDEIPATQIELWQCVDQTRHQRAQLESAQAEIKKIDLCQLYSNPAWPQQEQVITEQRQRISELEQELNQKIFTQDIQTTKKRNRK